MCDTYLGIQSFMTLIWSQVKEQLTLSCGLFLTQGGQLTEWVEVSHD